MLAMWLNAHPEQASIYPWHVLVPFFNRCDLSEPSERGNQQTQSTNSAGVAVPHRPSGSVSTEQNQMNGVMMNGHSVIGQSSSGSSVQTAVDSGGSGRVIECNTAVMDGVDPTGAVSDCMSTDPGTGNTQQDLTDTMNEVDESHSSTLAKSGSPLDVSMQSAEQARQLLLSRRPLVGFGVDLPADGCSSSIGAIKRRSFSTSCINNRKKGSKSSAEDRSHLTGSEEKIPRPMNAFMVFSKRQRQRVQEENKGLDNREISRKLGEMWYSLPEDEKQSYQKLAQEIKEKFKEKYPDMRYSSAKKEKRKSKSGSKLAEEDLNQEASTSSGKQPNVQLYSSKQSEQFNPATPQGRSQSVLSVDGDDVDGLPNVDFDDDDVIVDDVTSSSAPKLNGNSSRVPTESLADIKAKEFQRMRSSSYGGGPLSSLQQMNAAAASYAAAANPLAMSSFLGLHQMGLQNQLVSQMQSATNDIYMRALLQSVASASLPKTASELLTGSSKAFNDSMPYFPNQLTSSASSLSAASLLNAGLFGEPSAKRSANHLNSSPAVDGTLGMGLPQYKPLADHTASMLQRAENLSLPRTSRTYSVDSSSTINRSSGSLLSQQLGTSKLSQTYSQMARTDKEREAHSRGVSMSLSDSHRKCDQTSSGYSHMVNTPCPTGLLTFAKPYNPRTLYGDRKSSSVGLENSASNSRALAMEIDDSEISIKSSSHTKQPSSRSPKGSNKGFISDSPSSCSTSCTSAEPNGSRIVKAPLANVPCTRPAGVKQTKQQSVESSPKDCKGMNESEMEDELIEVDHEPQDLRMNTTVTQQQQEKGGDLSDKSKQEVTVSFRNQNANVEKMLEEVDFTTKFSKLPGRSSRTMLGDLNKQIADTVTVDSLYPRKRRGSYQAAGVDARSEVACGSGDEMQRKQSASGNMASTAASVALTENVKQMTPLADSNGMPVDEKNNGKPNGASANSNKLLTRRRAIAFELISKELYPNDNVINEWFQRNHQLFGSRERFLKVLREVRQQYMKQTRAAINGGSASASIASGASSTVATNSAQGSATKENKELNQMKSPLVASNSDA